MPFKVKEAAASDGAALAALLMSTITPLMKYQLGKLTRLGRQRFGTAPLGDIQHVFEGSHTGELRSIERGSSEHVYLKLMGEGPSMNESASIIAWADWIVPDNKVRPIFPEAFSIPELPLGMNWAFCLLANKGIAAMRDRTVGDRKCYVLKQINTLPSHQHRGAGAKLISWGTERADAEEMLCCLDIELNEGLIKFFEKMGFVRVDECSVPLNKCGLEEGTYTHIAMVREPKMPAGSRKKEDGTVSQDFDSWEGGPRTIN